MGQAKLRGTREERIAQAKENAFNTVEAYNILAAMIAQDKELGEKRSVFLNEENGNYEKARGIGKKLWELGEKTKGDSGYDLMLWMCDELKCFANPLPGDLRMLEVCWDGIGTWRC